jgi:type I restriction enzyme M protein
MIRIHPHLNRKTPFRKSGAQNKTSILFFNKFTRAERRRFDREYNRLLERGIDPGDAVGTAITAANLSYDVFLGEANHVGYTTVGVASSQNDLYRNGDNGAMNPDQTGTVLHEWNIFRADATNYQGRTSPDCMSISFDQLWSAHTSHRLDPKYHLFNREAARPLPGGWVRAAISTVMRRREVEAHPESEPDQLFQVMTISQTGEIRAREAGKGKNPPQWLGAYFADSPGSWFAARGGDVVFSSIDLWKGCIAIVPEQFDGALVSKEFPIYEVIDQRLSASFLQCLLRSRYYQRAFRAITTGHSNRRRTQAADFEALQIAFPQSRDEQERLIEGIQQARQGQRTAVDTLRHEFNQLSDLIDGRGDEDLPGIPDDDSEEEQPSAG